MRPTILQIALSVYVGLLSLTSAPSAQTGNCSAMDAREANYHCRQWRAR